MQLEKKSLYGLTSELRTIDELLEQSEETGLFERQNELTMLIQEKADSIVYYVQSQDDLLDAIEKRLKEIQDLKRKQLAKMERFETYVISCLDMLGAEKVTGQMATIQIKKPLKKVEVYDQNLLPVEFLRTKTIVEPDKIALKKALDSHEEIQGAKLVDGDRGLKYKLGK